MTDYEELAKRCEAATGADRELEARIWCVLNGKRYKGHSQAYRSNETQVEYTEPPKRTRHVTSGYRGNPHPPRWTASIDAAMTLVPAGCDWLMDNFDGDCGKPSAWVHKRGSAREIVSITGATPALALTAASLRAIPKGETP